MKYASFICQILPTFAGEPTLAELLNRIDALDKSIPTLAELNEAFAEIKLSGDFSQYDWHTVTTEAYSQALAQNHEAMVRFLEKQGISKEHQAQSLRWHATLWPKRNA